MSKTWCYLINSLCLLLYRGEYKKYISIKDLKKQQEEKINKIINFNKKTDFGKKHEFDYIKSIEDYQNKVPLSSYEDYIPYIEKIKNGQKNVLCEEPIILFEKTSGSVSKSKLIPYTKALKNEFQCGIKPWIYNLYTSIPSIKFGKSYWSVTPVGMKKEYTKCGIPIGFEEDSEYFGKIEKKLIEKIFVTPKDIAKESNMDKFYFRTVYSLLKCENLTLISIWNPTLLLLILDYLDKNKEILLQAIGKKRRNKIYKYVENKEYTKIWPNLSIISCWCDGNSREYSKKLQEIFKGVLIEPKGLLSTEAFISFSFVGEEGSRLSFNSHFFEFISLDDNKIYLANELKEGKSYEVVVTTSGGLYRYRMKDTINVCGFSENIPRFIFTGRRDKVCDLFGEKLNEKFIEEVIKNLHLDIIFYMVAPEKDKYTLYIMTENKLPDIDKLFRENFHYDYCRKLGQLKKLKVFKLTGNPQKEYIDECIRRGQRMGDIKPMVLSLKNNWDKAFSGKYINN